MIPNPYKYLIAAVAFVLWSGFMVYGGWYECTVRRLAAEKVSADKAAAELAAATKKLNKASAQLEADETIIRNTTIERTKHVPQVTTGRDCLSAAAVRLLNNNAATGPTDSGKPADEGPTASAATDTDVENWAIQAQGLYDTCATRLNRLIDIETGVEE